MTVREFFNAWIGYSEASTQDSEILRNIVYGASKYNAASTAFSKEQSKSISRQRFPWEKQHKGKKMSFDDMKPFLKALTGKKDG